MCAHFHSPRIVTDGLVLALDAANVKSFRGEPTENKINPNGFVGDVNFTVEKIAEYTFKVTLNSMPSSNGYYISQNHTSLANVPTTMSVEVLQVTNPSWVVGISGWGNITAPNGYIIGNRYIRTITHNVNWNYSISLGYVSQNFRNNVNVGDYIIVRFAQIEEKPYATPFVNGTRGTTVATGGGWADRSGNGNHGELVNGPTFDSDNLGSLVFDGTDSHLRPTTEVNLQPPWTQRIVYKNLESTSTTAFRAAVHGNSSTSRPGYIRIYNDISGSTARIRILMRYGNPTGGWSSFSDYVGPFGSSYVSFAQQDAFWVDKVMDLTITCSENNIYRYYIDGQLVFTRNRSTSGDVDNGLRVNRIGARGNGTTEPLNGFIYISKFYDTELSADEVEQNYNATKSRYGL